MRASIGHLRGTQFDVVNTSIDAVEGEVSVLPQAITDGALAENVPGHRRSRDIPVDHVVGNGTVGGRLAQRVTHEVEGVDTLAELGEDGFQLG